jgi:hypothetical protein
MSQTDLAKRLEEQLAAAGVDSKAGGVAPVEEGDQFRSELNNVVVEVVDRTADVVAVETDGGDSWRERVSDVHEKVLEGDWTPLDRGGVSVTAQADKVEECVHSYLEDNPDADKAEAYAVCNAEFSATFETPGSVDAKAEFAEGNAVRWTWDGEPVHGRVAEVRPDQATVSGNTITGDEGEPVYVIDEWDDRVGGYRRENVAKPESSLNDSQKDLPDRDEEHYVSSEAYDALTTVVSESAFTRRELSYISRKMDGAVTHHRPGEFRIVGTPLGFKYDIPDKYLEGRSEEVFVPNAEVAEAARKVQQWAEEHPDEFDAGGEDGELLRRAEQLVEHHERGEPLALEYWEEIENFHSRKHEQGTHELAAEAEGEPWTDNGYAGHEGWGGDAGYEQAQRVMDVVESVDQESAMELRGAVATEQSVSPENLTKGDTNKVDLEALEGALREAVEADDFYVYGKASIEQWDDDHPPTYIQMDALEEALDRYFRSEVAPGIISRHHQDIPVGVPVESFEFSEDTTLEIDGETYQFAAGDEAHTHVEDADGDGQPELWLAANISNDTEMGKKTRVLAAQGDLNGFSVTVHRNDDELTSEGRYVTECDLHAVTIGTDDQIKNPGSEFDVADFKGPLRRVRDRVVSFLG